MIAATGGVGPKALGAAIVITLIPLIATVGPAYFAYHAYDGYAQKQKIDTVIHSCGTIKTAVTSYAIDTNSAPLAAADEQEIRQIYGIDVASHYATFAVIAPVGAEGTIAATIRNVGSDLDGLTIVLVPDPGMKTWSWRGTVPESYLPRG